MLCKQPVIHLCTCALSAETFRKRFTNVKDVAELQEMLKYIMEGACMLCVYSACTNACVYMCASECVAVCVLAPCTCMHCVRSPSEDVRKQGEQGNFKVFIAMIEALISKLQGMVIWTSILTMYLCSGQECML